MNVKTIILKLANAYHVIMDIMFQREFVNPYTLFVYK